MRNPVAKLAKAKSIDTTTTRAKMTSHIMLISAWWNSLWEILKQITVFLVCYHLQSAGAGNVH